MNFLEDTNYFYKYEIEFLSESDILTLAVGLVKRLNGEYNYIIL